MGPGFAVINDLEQLRRLYAMSGHEGEIIAVYHEVLNKTQDPMLRHYVYDSLAREQLKPANPDQAIATLRTSLSEDLVAANRPPRGMPAEAATGLRSRSKARTRLQRSRLSTVNSERQSTGAAIRPVRAIALEALPSQQRSRFGTLR